MSAQYVLYATPTTPGLAEQVMGIVREERQARRICHAIDLGPTGFRDARYERHDDRWTKYLPGLAIGLKTADSAAKQKWRLERTGSGNGRCTYRPIIDQSERGCALGN